MRWSNAVTTVPALADHEVHVWQATLDLPRLQFDAAWQLLDSHERKRALRYKFERDQQRFVAGRGQLRALLSRYIAIPPMEVAFSYDTYGKPYLAGPSGTMLHFSVAHTADRALFALCRSAPIGIDIERIQSAIDVMGLATAFFAPEEYSALQSLGPQAQSQTFFRLWVCKEAYIKANGQGLSLPLDSFAIAIEQDAARLLYSHNGAEANWQIYEPEVGAGFTAALVVASCGLRLRYDA